ncbi:hypothetical protein [Natrialba sp. PRR66]|uniref:hypothetical protein n=1 Tax=Natrialba sp. PRR66 TaxID=3098146 RepID=UPI002B1D93AF|nr:hypothetical protein [Natrialba sp. PRR66]
MSCPFLDYRLEANERKFDEPRAYCEAAARFVQPMRADICNDRYDLAHDSDCEIYLEHAGAADENEGKNEREPKNGTENRSGDGDENRAGSGEDA